MALTLAQESWKSSELGGGAGGLAAEGSNSNQRRPQSHGGGGGVRERLFEKVVTPSDVGKLNRLVVPKHFAEKHLPLLGAAARAGTVLCFHDARGHAAWRFRYSYWGSSQSYVMTKGWSRYVRDKRLAAGDTVSFCRDGARLYIDCRRRAKRAQAASLLFGATAAAAAANNNNKAQQPLESAGIIDITGEDARRGRRLRLFGVDLELRAEPLLLDLQL